MILKSVNDKELTNIIKGCKKWRRKSQKALYQEYYTYAISICLRYADCRDEAEEMLNDGFLKVFQNISSFEIDKPFKPWLRRIVVNTAINHYHKNKRYKQTETIEDNPRDYAHTEEITGDINYKELVSMVHTLSPQYRAVFNLYVLEGYKHQEIAELLGISEGTSKSNLAKAKKVLQGKLENYFLNDENRPITR